jgi:poly [ADP-ribose] polymerase
MVLCQQIEYAKTDRSTCKSCKKGITKGALRIAKLIPSPKFDGYMEQWFHSACLFKVIFYFVFSFSFLSLSLCAFRVSFSLCLLLCWFTPSLQKRIISSSSQLLGFDSVRLEDQETLRQLIGEKPTSTANLTPTATELSLNSKLWELKSLLEKNCQLKELREMLQCNGIPSSGGRSHLIDKIADAMIYGVPICPICMQ